KLLWRVLFGFERDRVHENVAADPVPEDLLNLNEVCGDSGTNPLALRIHKIDDHDLVLDQIIVESDLLAFVSSQFEVWKVTSLRSITRRFVVVSRRHNPARLASRREPCKHFSSFHVRHVLSPFCADAAARHFARRAAKAFRPPLVTEAAALAVVPDIVNVESQHHRVVLVNDVVAMHWVTPNEIAEPEKQFDVIVLTQPHDILPAPLDGRRCVSVAADDLVLLEVNVYRVLPVESAFQLPRFGGIALN